MAKEIVTMKPYDGPEVVHSNRNIRKLLNLARAGPADVFYDLGCGKGQLCIVAASEFHVKLAVGIERRKDRARKAKDLVKRLGLSRRIEILNEDYQDSDFAKATMAYNGLMEEEGDLEFYSNKLPLGCKLVTLQLPLVGVLPVKQDYPFYLMRKPFDRTKRAQTWVTSVLSKKASVEELIRELQGDPDYSTDIRSLKTMMKGRFTG